MVARLDFCGIAPVAVQKRTLSKAKITGNTMDRRPPTIRSFAGMIKRIAPVRFPVPSPDSLCRPPAVSAVPPVSQVPPVVEWPPQTPSLRRSVTASSA